MSMEEYEIECLRKEAEMEDEESRKDSQIVNEAWIDALDEVFRRLDPCFDVAAEHCGFSNGVIEVNEVVGVLRSIHYEAIARLPKDHEKYMDQQGDQPNKNKGDE